MRTADYRFPIEYCQNGIVEEECDGSMYWMELIVEAGLMEEKLLMDLKNEANEILSMIVASIKTAHSRK